MRIPVIMMLTGLALSACTGHSNSGVRNIHGKWRNNYVDRGQNFEFIANFRTDGTYDGILNGKVLVSGGKYREHGDTISFQDPICNAAYTGVYRLNYHEDSVTFHVISDTCTLRRMGTDEVGMKRLDP